MNVDRILRMLFRRTLFRGLNKGADMLAKNSGQTPQERQAAKKSARNAKKALRVARRINRMR